MAESDLERAMAFAIRCAGLPAPEREFRFHPVRKWRFDFCWPSQKVALEVEGGSWVAGAHNRGQHFEGDAVKYSEAAILGWKVLRVTNRMIEDNRAIDLVERALASSSAARPTSGTGYCGHGFSTQKMLRPRLVSNRPT